MNTTIRPFKIAIPQEQLADLLRRLTGACRKRG